MYLFLEYSYSIICITAILILGLHYASAPGKALNWWRRFWVDPKTGSLIGWYYKWRAKKAFAQADLFQEVLFLEKSLLTQAGRIQKQVQIREWEDAGECFLEKSIEYSEWSFHKFIADAMIACPQCMSTLYGPLFLIIVGSNFGVSFWEEVNPFRYDIMTGFKFEWYRAALVPCYTLVLSFVILVMDRIYSILVYCKVKMQKASLHE